MFSFTKAQMALVASVLAPLVASAGIGIEDTGTPAGCTGSVCCIPSCRVSVNSVAGCSSGYVDWSANCQQNFNNPKGTQDIDGCDGYEMSWTTSQVDNTTPVIVVREKDNGATNTFAVQNCQTPTEGGSQCVPKGGGCDATPIFVKRSRAVRM